MNALEFMARWGADAQTIDGKACLDALLRQMEEGLAVRGRIPMVPSYLPPQIAVPDGTVCAGGYLDDVIAVAWAATREAGLLDTIPPADLGSVSRLLTEAPLSAAAQTAAIAVHRAAKIAAVLCAGPILRVRGIAKTSALLWRDPSIGGSRASGRHSTGSWMNCFRMGSPAGSSKAKTPALSVRPAPPGRRKCEKGISGRDSFFCGSFVRENLLFRLFSNIII